MTLGAALDSSRGLFAQLPQEQLIAPADQSRAVLLGVDIRFAKRREYQFTRPGSVKALYVNAWAFSGSRLWELVRLADSTDVNALVVDVKDDTGCLLYRSRVATARAIGADQCARTNDVEARLDTLHAHGIYAIARIVVAKDPLLAERKPGLVRSVALGRAVARPHRQCLGRCVQRLRMGVCRTAGA